jgi:hypothetical protein
MSQMVIDGAQMPRGDAGAALGWEAGARITGARGDPRAVSCREAGARTTGTRGSPGAAPSRSARAVV